MTFTAVDLKGSRSSGVVCRHGLGEAKLRGSEEPGKGSPRGLHFALRIMLVNAYRPFYS